MSLTIHDIPELGGITGAKRGARKYNNVPTSIDGHRFDSRAEARRWADLKILVRAREISDLQRQVQYVLIPSQERPSGGIERQVAYIADFVYRDKKGCVVVEDVKGASPDVWVIKRKLMLHVHGIEVREIKA